MRGERTADRTRVLAGLGVVVLALLVASAFQLLVTPAFRPVDERSWVDYGWDVSGGDLPSINEPLGSAPIGTPPAAHYQTAAHHPPLFPLVAGVTLRALEGLGMDDGAVVAARLVSLLALAVVAVALAGVVSELLPGRPQAWVGSVLVVVGLPAITQLGAVVYSDLAALAAGLVATWGALRIWRVGPTSVRLVGTGVAVAACGLLRFSAVVVAVVPIALVVAGVARHAASRGRWPALLRGAATGAALVALVVLTSGWFYLRNVRHYGGVSGGSYLYELLGRRPRPLSNILTEAFWAKRYRSLWDGREYGSGEFAAPGLVGLAWRYLWLWIGAGVVVGVVHVARRRGAPRTASQSALGITGWLVLVAAAAATVALVAYGLVAHVRDGGNGHVRYLLPAWWVLAFGVAAVLAAAGRRVSVLLVGLSWLALLWGTVAVIDEAIVAAGLRGASGDDVVARMASLAGTFAAPGAGLLWVLGLTAAGTVVAVPWTLARVPTDLG